MQAGGSVGVEDAWIRIDAPFPMADTVWGGIVGDHDGDGFDDLLFTSSAASPREIRRWSGADVAAAPGVYTWESGAVVVHSGSLNIEAVVSPGDADGDGLADLWVHQQAETSGLGSLHFLSGADLSGPSTTLGPETLRWAFSLDLGRRGPRLVPVGDVDGDSRGDLAFVVQGGLAHWLPGARSGEAGPLDPATLGVLPLPVGAVFGRSVVALGDIDGDGLDDVGVSTEEAQCLPGSFPSPCSFVYRGADLASQTVDGVEDARPAIVTLDGYEGGLLGASDLDGDGAPELLVAGYAEVPLGQRHALTYVPGSGG